MVFSSSAIALPPSAPVSLPLLEIRQLMKGFHRQGLPVLQGIDLTLQEGELLGLLGPSGCGKTTLLRLIAGFDRPSQGEILFQGQLVSSPQMLLPPEQRHTGMVFQDYALFPHLTIGDNVAFGLRHRRPKPKPLAIRDRVAEVLALVGLGGLEKRYPHELSGGQQQRIALARALAPQPPLILLDEPLSNLDVQVRHHLRSEIRRILKATHTAGIFVTHDQEEALTIADRIGVMRQGHLEQLDRPEVVYGDPASRFVAEFVSRGHFLPVQRRGEQWWTDWGPLAPGAVWPADRPGEILVREEELDLVPQAQGPLEICDRQFLGREYRYCVRTPSGHCLHVRGRGDAPLAIGSRVTIALPPGPWKFFPQGDPGEAIAAKASALAMIETREENHPSTEGRSLP